MKRLVSACIVIAAGLASCLVASPHFSSTFQDVVVVSEDPVLFGGVPVGTTSPPHSVTLSPPGTTATMDQVNAITPMCSDFAVQTPMGLPGMISRTCAGSGSGTTTAPSGATGCVDTVYTFSGTFSPAVPGTSSCAVALALNSGSQTITFTGSGTSPMLQINVQPASINFGSVPKTIRSSPATLTVANAGSAPLTINSVMLTLNPSGAYSLMGNLGMHTLPVGTLENYSITCTPPVSGPFDGTVTVSSNDPMNPMIQVPLKCNGIDSDLVVTPSPVTFPSARVGEPPNDIQVNVQMTGSGTRTINGITLDNGSTPDLSMNNLPMLPVTLSSGSATSFKLHYSAATARMMGPMGGVTITATGLNPQDTIVNGAALQTSMSLTPAVVDLGPVCIGDTAHADIDVFANNLGSFKLNSVTGLSIPFSLTSFTPGTVVPGGGHATFTINAAPTMTGDLSQLATVNTDIPGMPTHDLMVKAQALPAGVAPTPSVVQFGTWMIGLASSLKKVQLTNCNTMPITLMSATIDGTPEFQIVNDPPIMNQVIAPMTSFEIDLLLIPQSAGGKTASLVLATDAGQQLVELDGAATGGTDNGGKRRESYLACGIGRFTSLWPIAVAFALLGLRRRRR